MTNTLVDNSSNISKQIYDKILPLVHLSSPTPSIVSVSLCICIVINFTWRKRDICMYVHIYNALTFVYTIMHSL